MVSLDSVNYTASSEYSNRTRKITHLQVHHATMTSLSGLRALMAPGGRTVSANGAMGNNGHLMGVVPESKRAFTSASSFDNNSYTIEVCNTTLAPNWGISDACHRRLARVAVDLHRQYGMPLDRAHIIGHNEVPGTYPTACPGPSMDLNRVVRYARELLAATAGGGTTPIVTPEGKTMYIEALNDGNYAKKGVIYTNDIGGHWRGVTNLEGEGYIKPLATQGKLPYVKFNGLDIDLLFAVNGVWEQATIDSATAPKWGAKPGTPLMGLGALSGRLSYPGTSDWAFPTVKPV